jgi:hypothetical protein
MSKSFDELVSFIGSDIADPTGPSAEKPPRSARHVTTVSWSWSPAHSRLSEYRIAADKDRKSWNLFEISYDQDSGKRIGARVATGSPYKEVDAKKAAYLLLRATWQAEKSLWEFDPTGFEVTQSGLLTENDLLDLTLDIEWLTQSSWLKLQSNQALDSLRMELPLAPNDQLVETLDEVEACARDLGLPTDFFELAKHYELAQPCLLSLVSLLVRDATLLRSEKARIGQQNIERLQHEIDLLVSELDDQKGRGGGMTIPSVKSRAKSFLESYVAEHGKLPSGEHVIHNFFKTTLDFDKLRERHSL